MKLFSLQNRLIGEMADTSAWVLFVKTVSCLNGEILGIDIVFQLPFTLHEAYDLERQRLSTFRKAVHFRPRFNFNTMLVHEQ